MEAIIDQIYRSIECMLEGDNRSLLRPSNDGEDGRYKDGFYDGIYAVKKKIDELVK